MENLSTDNLMKMQVEQLEKEKRELNERVRVVAKRLDHLERAYRKEERPLLAKDYEIQQANDRAAHEIAQKSRLETARLAHQQDLETKKRLLRMMEDYKAYRAVVTSKRDEEFAKRKQAAQQKIEEEKAKKRKAVLKQREEERLRREEEERIKREKEEEERRRVEGLCHRLLVSYGFISLIIMCQSNAVVRRKKLPQLRLLVKLKRRRSGKKLNDSPKRGVSGRLNAPRWLRRLVYSDSVKKRRTSALDKGRRQRVPRVLGAPVHLRGRTVGDGPLPLPLPRQRQPKHRLHCQVTLLYRNIVLVPCKVAGDRGKQPSVRPKQPASEKQRRGPKHHLIESRRRLQPLPPKFRVLLHLLRLGNLPHLNQLQLMTMGSGGWKQERLGGLSVAEHEQFIRLHHCIVQSIMIRMLTLPK